MRRATHNIVVALLLCVYGVVGVAGHLRVLGLIGVWDRHDVVGQARPVQQKSGRACVFQERHIPAASTPATHDPALVSGLPDLPMDGAAETLLAAADPLLLWQSVDHTSSRAPPSSAIVLILP